MATKKREGWQVGAPNWGRDDPRDRIRTPKPPRGNAAAAAKELRTGGDSSFRRIGGGGKRSRFTSG